MTSYMHYFPNVINRTELSHITNNAPKGLRYCNGQCQDYLAETDFNVGGPNLCKECSVLLRLFLKKLEAGTVTVEAFKANPDIVRGVEVVFDSKKECSVCKQSKNIDLFDEGRNTCKSCKAIQTSNRNNSDIEALYLDIEKVKSNIPLLEGILNRTPKDRLIKVLSYFHVGRKSTDTKADMILRTVEFFRKQIDPYMCQAGCGARLITQFTTCTGCVKKGEYTPRAKRLVNFEDNLPSICDTLTNIGYNESDKYNKMQIFHIARYLKVPQVKQGIKKMDMISKINDFLSSKKAIDDAVEKNRDEPSTSLALNGISVCTNNEDGYVNLSDLAKAGGKLIKHWNQNGNKNDFLSHLSRKTGIPIERLLYYKGGSNSERATYGHPQVAIAVAYWVSVEFAVEVGTWIHQIAVTGSFSRENAMNSQQILDLQVKLEKKNREYQKLEKKHEGMLLKRQYHKFKKGPAFYVIQTTDTKLKVGYDDIDVNMRFQTYRTLMPDIKVRYIVFTKDASLLETLILRRYADYKLEANHEIVYDVEVSAIIHAVTNALSWYNIPHTIATGEDLDIYNESINLLNKGESDELST